jgi:lysyl-tRNA synthetase, class I
LSRLDGLPVVGQGIIIMSTKQNNLLVHWADGTADRIIRQCGDKEKYVLASGITPSGVVHFGNFRETITVDFVARALRDRGKEVRFIFSWDDYDTFRKVPKNMPKQDELKEFLFQPIVDTPDPYGELSSYADHNEKSYESQLQKVGVVVEPIYQAKKYRSGDYLDQIIKTIENKEAIRKILDQYRSTPLKEDWLPVSVYCEKCNRDKIATIAFDGTSILTYTCELCGHEGKEDLKRPAGQSRAKLPWRTDWPMRWAFEKVDFEPGGKDHSSEGGSFSTGKEIVKTVYDWNAPIYLQYDFVSVKGRGGKMSSSSGDVITVNDVLKIYEPEMVRWIFASYKPNVDFAVSFDLDVIKTYEDFDRCERLAYGIESGNQKKVNMAKRVYQLSQIEKLPEEMPFQPAFRHLTNILQINDGDMESAKREYGDQIRNERDERRFKQRSECALFWLENYAPEEFKFGVNKERPSLDLNSSQTNFIGKLHGWLTDNWDSIETDKQLHEKLYEFIHEDDDLSPGDAFTCLYQTLISKEKGPKLAGFIRTIGKDRVLSLLA